MGTGYRGTYVISWAQLSFYGEVEDDSFPEGAIFRWRGLPTRIDGPASVLLPGPAFGQADLLSGAHRSLRRSSFETEIVEDGRIADDTALPGAGFVLGAGADRYVGRLIRTPRTGRTLLCFEDGVPPVGVPLTVLSMQDAETGLTRHLEAPGQLICFTRGTRIATPQGPRLVEDLAEGDLVATKDSGAQEIRWVGQRQMTGARLLAMPELRPIRIRAGALGADRPTEDLWVSPEHRMLYKGRNAQALFNTPEVLITARDLVNDHTVTVDHSVRETAYIHLLFDKQEVLWANGAETESFHPASASLEMVDRAQRAALLARFPHLGQDPAAYGEFARRALDRAEAEILLFDTALRH